MVLRVWKRGETKAERLESWAIVREDEEKKPEARFLVVGDFFPLSFNPDNLRSNLF
jgi:hypothetical protein